MVTISMDFADLEFVPVTLAFADGGSEEAQIKELEVQGGSVSAIVMLDDPVRPFKLEDDVDDDSVTLLESTRGGSYDSFEEALDADDFEPLHDVVAIESVAGP